jgi:hypothetical protein
MQFLRYPVVDMSPPPPPAAAAVAAHPQNLYNCGKVCLSLLGTWSGPGWDPAHSTLLQVRSRRGGEGGSKGVRAEERGQCKECKCGSIMGSIP